MEQTHRRRLYGFGGYWWALKDWERLDPTSYLFRGVLGKSFQEERKCMCSFIRFSWGCNSDSLRLEWRLVTWKVITKIITADSGFLKSLNLFKERERETSLVVQWLKLWATNAEGLGLIPGQGEWQTTSAFWPWDPHEQYEKAKRYDTERWTLQGGRCSICY